jgi:ribosomal 50S subunit-recycling heat shock protein
MRLDLYIKHIGIVKRRALAKETIDKNRVRVNDTLTKPSYVVKPQDILDIYFKEKTIRIRVLDPIDNYETIPQPQRKPSR